MDNSKKTMAIMFALLTAFNIYWIIAGHREVSDWFFAVLSGIGFVACMTKL